MGGDSRAPAPCAGRSVTEVADTYNGYCVKCRAKRDFEGEKVTLDNGSRAAQGQCPVCGTKMTRMLPKSA
jgi:hypothetical protein